VIRSVFLRSWWRLLLARADAHHCKPNYENELPLALHPICGSQWLPSDKKAQYADFNLDGEEESLGCDDGFTILNQHVALLSYFDN